MGESERQTLRCSLAMRSHLCPSAAPLDCSARRGCQGIAWPCVIRAKIDPWTDRSFLAHHKATVVVRQAMLYLRFYQFALDLLASRWSVWVGSQDPESPTGSTLTNLSAVFAHTRAKSHGLGWLCRCIFEPFDNMRPANLSRRIKRRQDAIYVESLWETTCLQGLTLTAASSIDRQSWFSNDP